MFLYMKHPSCRLYSCSPLWHKWRQLLRTVSAHVLRTCKNSSNRVHYLQEEREAAHRQATRDAVAAALADVAAKAATQSVAPAAQPATAAPQSEARPDSQGTMASERQSLPGGNAEPAVHVKARVLRSSFTPTVMPPTISELSASHQSASVRHFISVLVPA